MSFSDLPDPSPLRWRPLVVLGRKIAQLVHGNKRNDQEELLTTRYCLTDEVEWRLGQTYLGLIGLLALPLGGLYIEIFSEDVGYHAQGRHYLGHWGDLPADLRIILPLMFLDTMVGMASVVRYFDVAESFVPIDQHNE